MKHFVERTCTVVRGRDEERGGEAEWSRLGRAESRPLEAFREVPAYVLLGAPGAGKTEAFRHEARRERGHYITARDFLTFDPEPEWNDKTIYIDGLDETRAGASGGRTPFDGIRTKLQRLGRPSFRLSCREADWFGANDSERLKAVAPNGDLQVYRLDPLSHHGVLEILERNHDVGDPGAFVAEARKRGVEDLLLNPQNLRMLAEAVAEAKEEWPRTRTETFHMACRGLVSEENPEHQIACSGTFNTKALLDGAGDLCALLLLAGKVGVTLPGSMPDASHPRLDRFPGGDTELLRRVVGTNLFESLSEGCRTPAHRQIAEFLAARRLADLIHGGLSVRRTLSLMTGFDGGIITQFRGLASWLAALSTHARHQIIERDPLGVVFYGDVRRFSPREKVQLFVHLSREAHQDPWLLRDGSLDAQLGELIVPELEGQFRRALTASPTTEVDNAVTGMVLRVFEHGEVPIRFEDDLLSVVRDSRWPASIRYRALDLCVQMQGQAEGTADKLLALLRHLYHTEKHRVTCNELCGRLLHALYPSRISIKQACRFLRHPLSSALYDSYDRFWRDTVIRRSAPDQLLDLLQVLRKRLEEAPNLYNPGPEGVDLPDGLPDRCLKALLSKSPCKGSPSLIYYWLGAYFPIPLLDLAFLLQWLSERPGIRTKVIELAELDEDVDRAQRIAALAVRAGHASRDLPGYLQSIRYGTRSGHVQSETLRHSRVAEAPDPIDYGRRTPDPGFERYVREVRDYFRSNLAAVRENHGPPALLHDLAKTYLGSFAGLSATTGRGRLLEVLGDRDMVDAALSALASAITRPDLPAVSELLRLARSDRLHLLAYPVMAGLRERTRTDPASVFQLEDRQLGIALTLWHTTGEPPRILRRSSSGMSTPSGDWESIPQWTTALTKSRPALVTDVLVSVSRHLLRVGKVPRQGYRHLAYPRESLELTKLATTRLLEAFPVRCQNELLPHLDDLLVAACCFSDRSVFVKVIENKLKCRSMNIGQRVRWLVAGHLVAPERYAEPLESFVTENERRIHHLAAMVVDHGGLPARLRESWDIPVVVPLIRLLGSFWKPTPELQSGVVDTVTRDTEAADCVSELIAGLAKVPTDNSAAALAELLDDPLMQRWSSELSAAAYRQRRLRREAEFGHPDTQQVAEVLDSGRPANAADLWAIAVDLLNRISREIRDGATSDWRQHWNVDKDNKAVKPKPENACRDALLSDLRRELTPLGIDGVREGSYKDDKRSDIRLSVPGFNVPIEIKRSCHGDWWSAIKSQLIAQYTRDPGTDGYGIYLVFWFGEAEGCKPKPASGWRPKLPAEVRKALVDSLSRHERRKISVCVIDVSKPARRT